MAPAPISVYRTGQGLVAELEGSRRWLVDASLDELFRQQDPPGWLRWQMERSPNVTEAAPPEPPIESQEVWAAGVTYLRSRDARMDESRLAGGETFYDRVYAADRPELFFKATAHRVIARGGRVRLRSDSHWNVPEPEAALAINSGGHIFGYTIGNDMSSRDIEGENPLYLPQAKVYTGCCGLGPAIVVREPLPRETRIEMSISRQGAEVFTGATSLANMKRGFEELVAYLFRDNSFPNGCFLLTGTGIVPPPSFTLSPGDVIHIRIDGLGELVNSVE